VGRDRGNITCIIFPKPHSKRERLSQKYLVGLRRDNLTAEPTMNTTLTTQSRGYAIIRGVISLDVARELLASIPGTLKVLINEEEYTEYEAPPLALRIRQDFDKVSPILSRAISHANTLFFAKNGDKTEVRQLLGRSDEKLWATTVGAFHKTNVTPTRRKGRAKAVYITIALTDLNPENGWFTFLEGSHRTDPSVCAKVEFRIKAGDAIVWSGDVRFMTNPLGGGGYHLTFAYE
jgi:ectoine hydroxylase-related dioxygenase (phytanoyl-CoA dioxygenase family)